jgi:hypothetical protein
MRTQAARLDHRAEQRGAAADVIQEVELGLLGGLSHHGMSGEMDHRVHAFAPQQVPERTGFGQMQFVKQKSTDVMFVTTR